MNKKGGANSLENIFVSETHRAIYQEISHLKKRIHLVEGERKANYELNEEQIKRNESTLSEHRSQNSQLKLQSKETQSSRKDYFSQIKNLLNGDERKAFPFRGKNFDETRDILECKIGDFRNKLNLLQFEKGKLKDGMIHILKEEEGLRRALGEVELPQTKKKPVNPAVNEIKESENSTALVQMRIIEAENIRSRYKMMLSTLKDVNFSKGIRIRELESKITGQNKEVARIKRVVKEANKASSISLKKLAEIEEQTIKEYTEREKSLFEKRLKLKQIRENMETIGGKISFPKFQMIHRDSSSMGEVMGAGFLTAGVGGGGDLMSGGDPMKAKSIIEIIYGKLRESTGESDPELIVTRVQEQRDHCKELEGHETRIKSDLRKNKLKKRFLQDKLHQLRFSGGSKREELNEQGGSIDGEISYVQAQIQESRDLNKKYSEILDQMLLKLISIIEINELGPLPDFSVDEYTGGRILRILGLILEKIETVLEEGEREAFSSRRASPTGSIAHEESFLSGISRSLAGSEVCLVENNLGMIRRPSVAIPGEIPPLISLPDLSTASGEMTFRGSTLAIEGGGDGRKRSSGRSPQGFAGKRSSGGSTSEEEEAVTRNYIKRQSQILVEAKTRKGRFNANTASQSARPMRH